MVTIALAVVMTLIYGGLTFGILLSFWSKPEKQQGIGDLFAVWVVGGLSVHFGIIGWQAVL